MGLGSMLFGNPAVKIFEGRLWEAARKRYLGEHPYDLDDSRSVMRKVRAEYKDDVAPKVKVADEQVRAKWSEFKHGMTEQLKKALATVLRMSYVEWYAVEAGQLPQPEVIAVPFQLLMHISADLMPQFLKKNIDFENLNDQMLEALSCYAVDQKFEEVLQDARRNHAPFEIGDRGCHFVVTEIIKRDAYFLGDEQHHSQVDMVILSRIGEISTDSSKNNESAATKERLDQGRRNRRNDRRFTGDGWEIEFEELKACATQPRSD
jgi:hypothetical protein